MQRRAGSVGSVAPPGPTTADTGQAAAGAAGWCRGCRQRLPPGTAGAAAPAVSWVLLVLAPGATAGWGWLAVSGCRHAGGGCLQGATSAALQQQCPPHDGLPQQCWVMRRNTGAGRRLARFGGGSAERHAGVGHARLQAQPTVCNGFRGEKLCTGSPCQPGAEWMVPARRGGQASCTASGVPAPAVAAAWMYPSMPTLLVALGRRHSRSSSSCCCCSAQAPMSRPSSPSMPAGCVSRAINMGINNKDSQFDREWWLAGLRYGNAVTHPCRRAKAEMKLPPHESPLTNCLQ